MPAHRELVSSQDRLIPPCFNRFLMAIVWSKVVGVYRGHFPSTSKLGWHLYQRVCYYSSCLFLPLYRFFKPISPKCNLFLLGGSSGLEHCIPSVPNTTKQVSGLIQDFTLNSKFQSVSIFSRLSDLNLFGPDSIFVFEPGQSSFPCVLFHVL